MKHPAIIFDLDGTLLDSLADLAASVNHALQTHGMPTRSIDEVRTFVGNGVRHLMSEAVVPGTASSLFEQVFAFQAKKRLKPLSKRKTEREDCPRSEDYTNNYRQYGKNNGAYISGNFQI